MRGQCGQRAQSLRVVLVRCGVQPAQPLAKAGEVLAFHDVFDADLRLRPRLTAPRRAQIERIFLRGWLSRASAILRPARRIETEGHPRRFRTGRPLQRLPRRMRIEPGILFPRPRILRRRPAAGRQRQSCAHCDPNKPPHVAQPRIPSVTAQGRRRKASEFTVFSLQLMQWGSRHPLPASAVGRDKPVRVGAGPLIPC